MRILMISPTLGDAYGQERVMRDSSVLLRREGHDVFFLADKKTGEIPDSDGHCFVDGLSSLHTLTPLSAANRLLSTALEYTDRLDPDIVHFIDQFDFRLMKALSRKYPTLLTAHTVAPSCPASHRLVKGGGACEKKSGLSCLVHHYDYGCLSHFKSALHRFHAITEFSLKKNAVRNFPVVAAISKYIRNTLIADGWDAEKVRLVYNPVRIPEGEHLALPETPKNLIVAACRLVALKGLEHLLNSLALLSQKDWTLWICGEGELKESLERQARELGIGHRVFFKGRTSAELTWQIMLSSRMVVQPNIGPEGFGLTVAEASALGIPVVAFDIPALNEIIENEVNGLLVPAKDDQLLSQAITRLIDDEALHSRLSAQGPQLMDDRFAPEVHLAQTLAAYHAARNDFQGSGNLLSLEVNFGRE